MLYTNGRVYRDKVQLKVLRGFSPTSPNKLSAHLAPATQALAADCIKSGMAIVKSSGEWVQAEAADATAGTSIFIALQDYDSFDVQASGKLTGLDCSDEYEVQTGYFAAGTYAVDDYITVGADGVFKEAAVGDFAIGRITAVGSVTGGYINIAGTDKSTSQTDVTASAAGNANVIQFKTGLRYKIPAP